MSELKAGEWIGMDLDGTVFEYHGWVGWNVFGPPIIPMVRRIRGWTEEGRDVRIVTARVGLPIAGQHNGLYLRYSTVKNAVCRITGARFSDDQMVTEIQKHLIKHGMPALRVQCYKDVSMRELWDDRAVQVIPNTGMTLADAHEAEMTALRGKAQGHE